MVDVRIRGDLPSVSGYGVARWLSLTAVFTLVFAITLAVAPKPALAQVSVEKGAQAEEEAAALDCSDFATQRGAQAIFTRSPKASAGDPFKLDENGDGIACEAKPGGTAEDGTKLGTKTGGDLDCIDFPSQRAAQARLRADPSDPNGLDPETKGIACEITPVPYKDSAFDNAPVAAARSNADLDCKDFEYQQEAQVVYSQNPSDPNGLDGSNEEAEKEKRFVGNGVACESLPLLASNVTELVGKDIAKAKPPAPAIALLAAWPHGGKSGFLLDLAALLLVTGGVSVLLIVRHTRRSS